MIKIETVHGADVATFAIAIDAWQYLRSQHPRNKYRSHLSPIVAVAPNGSRFDGPFDTTLPMNSNIPADNSLADFCQWHMSNR